MKSPMRVHRSGFGVEDLGDHVRVWLEPGSVCGRAGGDAVDVACQIVAGDVAGLLPFNA